MGTCGIRMNGGLPRPRLTTAAGCFAATTAFASRRRGVATRAYPGGNLAPRMSASFRDINISSDVSSDVSSGSGEAVLYIAPLIIHSPSNPSSCVRFCATCTRS
eukprot:2017206-Pyramimonas_sp.AAC.2